MKSSLLGLFVVGIVLTAIASANDAKDEAIQKDRKQIEGTWRVVALEIDGNKASDEDAKKLTVVNGSDGTLSVLSESKEVAKGTSTFDPTKSPKTIDFTATDTEGNTDQFVGIYELEENTRRLCFVKVGKDRPTEFSSPSGSQYFLVTFEREKAK